MVDDGKNLKPGDIIEWVYKRTGTLVSEREALWSTLMKRYVPIGSALVHTLISIDGEQITWVNVEGCFHASMDDVMDGLTLESEWPVLPRTCG